jgi:sugar/nucleoside kinase (ribokinase family)
VAKVALACLGDLTLDIVVRGSAPAALGTDVAATVRFRAGGSAANTARAFAALGGKAVFIGALGDDEVGGRLRTFMRSAGVTVHAPRVHGISPRLVVTVSPGGERSFLTDRGVADLLSPSMLRGSWLSGVGALHIPFYSFVNEPLASTAMAAVRDAHGRALVSVDLASRGPLVALGRRRIADILRATEPHVLFANEDELTAIGSPSPAALAKLAPISVIKQGPAGCRLVWRAPDGVVGSVTSVGQALVATRRVVASDTTGAGDAFDAGFLHALLIGGYGPAMKVNAALLRRAAIAGHRSAARLLTSPRKELAL